MAELGRAGLVLCLGLSAYAVVVGGWAVAMKRRRACPVCTERARRGVRLRARLNGCARDSALDARLLVLVYVARLTSDELPVGYALSAFWGGQEGSLLLWLFVLTGLLGARCLLLAAWRRQDLLLWVTADPRRRRVVLLVPARRDREPVRDPARASTNVFGLNPSLQNLHMVAHPPLLYLGYVGLTILFAFGMGSLLARRSDEAWLIAVRRWTLVAWTALGFGQLLGALGVRRGRLGRVLRVGSVENAALMPWLAATAFLHSVMIQEKRGMLKLWNMLLVILAFAPRSSARS